MARTCVMLTTWPLAEWFFLIQAWVTVLGYACAVHSIQPMRLQKICTPWSVTWHTLFVPRDSWLESSILDSGKTLNHVVCFPGPDVYTHSPDFPPPSCLTCPLFVLAPNAKYGFLSISVLPPSVAGGWRASCWQPNMFGASYESNFLVP